MNFTADVEDEGEDEEEEEEVEEEEQHRLRWQSDAIIDKWRFHDHTSTQADTGHHSEEEGKPPPVIEACAPQPEIGPGGWDRVQVSMRACNFGLTGWLSAYVNCFVLRFSASLRVGVPRSPPSQCARARASVSDVSCVALFYSLSARLGWTLVVRSTALGSNGMTSVPHNSTTAPLSWHKVQPRI